MRTMATSNPWTLTNWLEEASVEREETSQPTDLLLTDLRGQSGSGDLRGLGAGGRQPNCRRLIRQGPGIDGLGQVLEPLAPAA